MDPIRRKLSSFLTEAAHKGIKNLDSQSPCAKELSKIEDDDINDVIAEEIKRICEAAALAEVAKIFFLTYRLKKTSGQKREIIKNDLRKIAEALVVRVEKNSGQLKLPETCRNLILNL